MSELKMTVSRRLVHEAIDVCLAARVDVLPTYFIVCRPGQRPDILMPRNEKPGRCPGLHSIPGGA
jgi:hypothetical protein